VIVGLAAGGLEHHHDLGIERVDVLGLEILLRVEGQAVDPRPQRLVGRIQRAQAAVVVGVAAADVIPLAVFGLTLEEDTDAGRGVALRRVQDVRGNRAHSKWPDGGPMQSP
jgi:hypothetical protein